jgi:hypothetical protein
MFSAAPELTPDEAKAALAGTAAPALAGTSGAGAGLVDAAAAIEAARSGRFAGARQDLALSSGTGAIDSTRGSFKPYTDWKERGKPEQLSAEADALGRPWSSAEWAARDWATDGWAGTPWAPHTSVSSRWGPADAAEPWSGLGDDEASWIAKSWGQAQLLGVPDWIAKSWGEAAWNESF